MLSEIKFYGQRRLPFAFETTLSGRSYLRFIQQLKNQGYKLHFFFLWVGAAEVALSRPPWPVPRRSVHSFHARD